MTIALRAVRADHPALPDRREHVRRSLNCGALHVVQHPADTAELFSTTGASGTSVHEHRQR